MRWLVEVSDEKSVVVQVPKPSLEKLDAAKDGDVVFLAVRVVEVVES